MFHGLEDLNVLGIAFGTFAGGATAASAIDGFKLFLGEFITLFAGDL